MPGAVLSVAPSITVGLGPRPQNIQPIKGPHDISDQVGIHPGDYPCIQIPHLKQRGGFGVSNSSIHKCNKGGEIPVKHISKLLNVLTPDDSVLLIY